ncbi:MAG: LysR family transcriptional regulator [Candidatus Kaistia colombiensis]|nr:MAG: LysR family transcriptional regulator [Kaistia sp.]
MHPRLLRTFLAVTRSRNLTRASEEVDLAQSSVSDQIQSLEAELGANLFTRSRQGLTLTPAGEVLKPYAEKILALTDEAKDAVEATAGHAAVSVTIGALETIASVKLPRWLSDVQDGHPHLDLQLKIAGSGELMRALGDGHIDVAFCFDKGADDERFAKRTVSLEPLVLIASQELSLDVAEDGFAALASTRFVATEVGCVYRQIFDRAFAEAGLVAPKLAAEVGSTRTIVQLVAAGMGLALLPRLAVAEPLDRGEIVEIPWPAPLASAPLVMIWRRRRVQPAALKLLLAAASNAFSPARSAGAPLQHAVSFRS